MSDVPDRSRINRDINNRMVPFTANWRLIESNSTQMSLKNR